MDATQKLEGYRPIKISFDSAFLAQEMNKIFNSKNFQIPKGENKKSYRKKVENKLIEIITKAD